MKAAKALRRLTKIESLMADVVEQYSGSSPAVRKALQDAMAAVVVAKEAVSLEVSSGMAMANGPVEHPAPKNAAEVPKSAPPQKAAPKKSAVKTEKKAAPVKKTGRQQHGSRTPTG
jgi:hypothetical protein